MNIHFQEVCPFQNFVQFVFESMQYRKLDKTALSLARCPDFEHHYPSGLLCSPSEHGKSPQRPITTSHCLESGKLPTSSRPSISGSLPSSSYICTFIPSGSLKRKVRRDALESTNLLSKQQLSSCPFFNPI